MILIISQKDDLSTTEVIRWLIAFNKNYIRLNEESTMVIDRLTANDFRFSIHSKSYKYTDIESVWYRRGELNFKLSLGIEDANIDLYNEKEHTHLKAYIHNLFKSKRLLNDFNIYEINKLEVLRYCHLNTINAPSFLVTQSKEEALSFFKTHQENIITKALKYPFLAREKKSLFASYTFKPSKENMTSLPQRFVPTFFQQYIEKRYEIRTFYLNERCYSMVIFSQNNPKTRIDFRHYDDNKPNRLSPYKLPSEYESKINKMMKSFGLNSASIDIVRSIENEYFLLEINPIGQFKMTSHPCNYDLEMKIAKYL